MAYLSAPIPASIYAITLPDARAQALLMGLANGSVTPSNGRGLSIVLFGPYGTGKSLVSRLLPLAMEESYSGQPLDLKGNAFLLVDCRQGATAAGAALKSLQRTIFNSSSASGKFYIVFDEIDNLSAAAQAAIYSQLQQSNLMVICTTNHVYKVDVGIRDRSYCIPVDLPPIASLVNLAAQINTQRNLGIPDEDLESIVARGDGTYRGVEAVVMATAGIDVGSEDVTAIPDGTTLHSAPQSLSDFSFPTTASRDASYSVALGRLPVPADRSLAVMIWGHPQSGKSTLARRLPSCIEAHSVTASEDFFDTLEYDCGPAQKGVSQIADIAAQSNRVGISTSSGRRYFILNDVDRLSDNAQRDLKSLMGNTSAVFIFTTNDLKEVNKGIVNRCHKICLRRKDASGLGIPWPTLNIPMPVAI